MSVIFSGMSIHYEFEPLETYLYAKLIGDYSLAEAKRVSVSLLETCRAHQRFKILMDVFSLKGEPTVYERFSYADYMASMYRDYIHQGFNLRQWAIVGTSPLIAPNRFGENVAVNRGMTVKVFFSIEEAQDWLGVAKLAVTS